MTIQNSIDLELPFLRAQALSRMTSRALVRRRTPDGTKDANGYTVDGWTVGAETSCRIAGTRNAQSSRTVTVGDSEVEAATRVGHFPLDTDLADDDLLDVTEGACVGVVFRVVEVQRADQQTALRVPLIEVNRPEEW